MMIQLVSNSIVLILRLVTNNILEEQVTELKIKAVLGSVDITEFY